ncbi:MAG: primosomal protein N', partial [Dehalococcoidales bacterium]|nr:primosomal protein N' [Dehalococcoidales bacterium]
PHLKVTEGQAVLVPFGAQILQGIVVQLTAEPAVEQTRDIAGIVDSRPLLSPERIELARWISDYYLAPIFDAIALLLPPGFERKVLTFVSAAVPEGFGGSSLTPDQQQVLDAIAKQQRAIGTATLGRLFGKKKAQQVITQLIKKHLLTRSYELEPIKVRAKTECYYALILSPSQARQEAQKLRSKAKRQADLLGFLTELQGPASAGTIRKRIGFNKSVADALIKKGFLSGTVANVRRDPLAHLKTNLSWPLPLTANQSSALSKITSSLGKVAAGTGSGDVFLLHGVTGSGKTEVYLQALAEAVKLGKKGIVLVPEIALTPQTLERFTARFPGRVAILHSQLTLGEQFDEWTRIRNGEVDVVVGPRSALFAPQPDLGLIVIDEEHEWSYKQTDRAPNYHARDAALRLAALTRASVILGSATPDVETYHHARNGDYQLLELPERLISAVPDDSQIGRTVLRTIDGSLPGVDVVDMREELKAGNRSLFSRALHQAVAGALSAGGQVILFLNRRGASTFVQCRRCGFSFRCRRCDVPMTYHAVEDAVICHQCNYRAPRPEFCPRCRSPQIKFLGLGTEKLEQETAEAFPQSRLLRWDSDTTQGWHAHQEILDKFRRHEAEILIGTQMVSKGLDMPRVTLVGVINADTGLNLPDFRAGERTFQLLSQVAGRAGRGPMGGRVVIQTYSPEHYTIQAAAKHDYNLFFKQEIDYRRQLSQPPFTRLAGMIYSHGSDELCRKEAERMKRELNEEKEANGLRDINILGPAPAFIRRRRGHFRWQLVVRGSHPSAFLREIDVPQGWKIDIDPIGLG